MFPAARRRRRLEGVAAAAGRDPEPAARTARRPHCSRSRGSAFVVLSLLGELWWWVTILILVREWGITVMRFVVIRYGVMAASKGGKTKTVLQTAALIALLLGIPMIGLTTGGILNMVLDPLFIYGPSGLGKTHLLNAIQIEIHKNHPDYNIVYVDCEKFTNEIITAVKMATTEQFRQKYREADVLLIDDIQFLAGKESTQEEFFHTFNTLHNAGKQIVLASDRPAKEIKSLEERLRTRFEWGLTADIQPPDFETRVAIVKRKAELLNLDLPDDVAEYIANHLKQNIRQLEGAVKKLNAYYMLEGIAPCIGVTTTAIKDTLNDTQPIPVTIEKIINEVARTYNVIPSDIRGKKRSANVSAARQMSMYIIREITGMSMEAIGSEFQRDHSTVVYSINTMEKNIGKDRHLKETVDDIMKNIRA